jgi:hypothetical protein
LAVAGFDHTLADGSGVVGVGWSVAGEFAKAHGGHVDMNVDAIQQWSGDAADVALNLQRRAAAFARRIVPESARALVRGVFVT